MNSLVRLAAFWGRKADKGDFRSRLRNLAGLAGRCCLGFCGLMAGLVTLAVAAMARPPAIAIVAAENFYADIARQIGDRAVTVTGILTNPDQDPHEFEASASTAKAFADARLVIYNGASYDPWAAKLAAASTALARTIVVVADLVHRKPGDNPHIWYDPAAMLALARSLAAILARLDPPHAAEYEGRLAAFERSLAPLTHDIAVMRRKYRATPVTATEPVFGYMSDALGLRMRNMRFQLAVMNDTEPSPADIAAFEQDLKSRAVKLLLYNTQTSSALTRKMRALAEAAGVAVVGVSETEPPGKNYQEWMRSQLAAVDQGLSR
jgi:zinc/manganese transport system substrate-binding protein